MVETAELPALGGLRSALEEALGCGLRRQGRALLPLHPGANPVLRDLLRLVLWARRKGDMKEGKAKSFGERIKGIRRSVQGGLQAV
jgi:hypothetical protein